MITKTITDFDIRQTADSGQCFRLNERQGGSYALVAGGRYLEISQRGGEITFSCTGTEFETLWRSYFDLDTDYAGMKESVDPADDYMRTAISFGGGIRILRQELWETLVTFIISQQNNIPRIKKCVESLCAQFGERRENYRGEPYYTFPSPSVLGQLPDEALDSIHLGYRSKYILKTARMVEEGAVDLSAIQKLKYEEAKAELMKCYGVGVKVAECVCLFALHHIDAFPVDTHIRKVILTHYPSGFPLNRYRGFAGVLQQYAFYYDVHGAG